MLFSITKNLSDFAYKFVLNPREGGSTESYNAIFVANNGMEWCFIFLLGVSLLFSMYYYWGTASKSQQATINNYLIMYVCGFVTLVLVTYLGLTAITEINVLTSFNVFKICLINILWYTILFEVLSLLLKDTKITKAHNIHLLSIFSK